MTEFPLSETDSPGDRRQAKEERRTAYLDAAARLFADHGYRGVSIEDLGAACGVSGPAVYRHFANKQAVLAALLLGVSRSLLDGSTMVADEGLEPDIVLQRLVEFQADFALSNADVIRVQDRDLGNLDDESAALVRQLQRDYIGVWTDQLQRLHPRESSDGARQRAQAVFGLLNSTPHSNTREESSTQRSRLVAMAWAALSAPVP
ncbi:TetR/AcrR family transcriptional regulator [Zhihengliuella salsuginis]|uniref:TetR family transcriptional regulator n=1 Tax=Zhihengliuella salsuginis TaxID=578222 RepID=A0ABQ3GHT4_9MICC|nr:TetR/AcrR family transcriptional regulator [Zhihengliuella salsuginis]GHD07631.1 TetR family transcriptional regulator [Zhihengliuella salsuginis]